MRFVFLFVWALVCLFVVADSYPTSAQQTTETKKEPKESKKEEAKKDAAKSKDKKEETPKEDEYDPIKADEEVLESGKIKNDPKSLIQFFQSRSLSETDRSKLGELIKQLGVDDFDTRIQAQQKLEEFGIAAIGLLRHAIRDEDPEIVRRVDRCIANIEKVPLSSLSIAAARSLARFKPKETAEVLIAYIPLVDDDMVSDEVRRTLAAVAMQDGKASPSLLKMLEEKDAIRRGAAAEALARGGDKEVRQVIRKFMDQEANLENKLLVALGLLNAGKEKDMIPLLIRLMSELPLEKSWRAEEILCLLAGEAAPAVSLGTTQESRKKAAEAWLEWWEKNADKVDLTKLENQQRILGYTIIMEMDIRGIAGRIIELDASGKERWKMTNVQFPIDCQVLPSNKILYVDQNLNKVAEYDLTTKKDVWSNLNLNQPKTAERLSNGNTVVFSANQIVEMDRNKKIVFNFNWNRHDLVAGKKLRSGEYVFLSQNGQCIRIDKDGKTAKTFNVGQINYMAGMDLLANNKILITTWNQIVEYDLTTGQAGKKLNYNQGCSVQRLPNGNTLVVSMNRNQVQELDRDGKSVWDYKSTDANMRALRAKKR